MRRAMSMAKRTALSFYRDQGTHHAAALTYYALMSLFPLLLLAVSLLGVLGEFPTTNNSIIHYLRGVVPETTLAPLDAALRAALRSRGTAVAALLIGILLALYGSPAPASPGASPVAVPLRSGRSSGGRLLSSARWSCSRFSIP
jgi:membrane protein